jgi:DNA-binding SARP family transcriptional activator
VLRLGGHLEQAAKLEEAVDVYRAALEIDDLAEELYRRMMHCLNGAGRTAEALAVYRRCETMLRTVLGVDPSSRTRSLYQDLISR